MAGGADELAGPFGSGTACRRGERDGERVSSDSSMKREPSCGRSSSPCCCAAARGSFSSSLGVQMAVWTRRCPMAFVVGRSASSIFHCDCITLARWPAKGRETGKGPRVSRIRKRSAKWARHWRLTTAGVSNQRANGIPRQGPMKRAWAAPIGEWALSAVGGLGRSGTRSRCGGSATWCFRHPRCMHLRFVSCTCSAASGARGASGAGRPGGARDSRLMGVRRRLSSEEPPLPTLGSSSCSSTEARTSSSPQVPWHLAATNTIALVVVALIACWPLGHDKTRLPGMKANRCSSH